MASQAQEQEEQHLTTTAVAAVKFSDNNNQLHYEKLLRSYVGLSFAIFIGFIPRESISLVSTLQSRNRDLCIKLVDAEERLSQFSWRRKEDSRANARVVEIFASHRQAWRREEKHLLQQIEAGADEIARLRARVEELEETDAELKQSVEEMKTEVWERDEMLNFMARGAEFEDSSEGGRGGGCGGGCCSEAAAAARFGNVRVSEERFVEREGDNVDELGALYGQSNGLSPEFLNSASKFWAERSSRLQDGQYESLEPLYQLKHFVARREFPWKVDGESTGVSSKLKLLEQEVLNLERISKNNLSKVPSQMRKQAKRYQALGDKIDDLCRRMASDPCETTPSLEFRT